jgi:hypothetical protein
MFDELKLKKISDPFVAIDVHTRLAVNESHTKELNVINRNELELLIVQLLGEVRAEERQLGDRLSRLHRGSKRPSPTVVTSLAKLDGKLNQLERMLEVLTPSHSLASAA